MTTPVKIEGMSLTDFMERTRERPIKFIDGEIIEMSPTISWHSVVLDNAKLLLDAQVIPHKLGRVFAETTYILPTASRISWVKGSRVPDVMFYERSRFTAYLKANPDWKEFPFALIPDVVIEVLSPNDRYSEVVRDIHTYLQDGVKQILVLDPDKKTLVVHTPETDRALILSETDTVVFDALLNGLTIKVSAFFAIAEEDEDEAE